jgi:hypothetical protein
VQNDTNPIAQATQILDRLFSLPCRQDLSVQARRYPRLLPAESGLGFEQSFSSFGNMDKPANAHQAIPRDAEEFVFIWRSCLGTTDLTREISTMVGSAFSDLALSSGWDYEVFLRHATHDSRHVVVRVFQSFANDAGAAVRDEV